LRASRWARASFGLRAELLASGDGAGKLARRQIAFSEQVMQARRKAADLGALHRDLCGDATREALASPQRFCRHCIVGAAFEDQSCTSTCTAALCKCTRQVSGQC
jgi:hypothetical protein